MGQVDRVVELLSLGAERGCQRIGNRVMWDFDVFEIAITRSGTEAFTSGLLSNTLGIA